MAKSNKASARNTKSPTPRLDTPTDISGNATEVIGIVMDLSIFRGLLRLDDDPEAEPWAA